ncbi:MAG: hypothetical protein GY899_09060 [Verrucomicrobiaceae bacterium]|nr:hypothetical protein [Verrucomicrobiaceae bacterium]
MSAKGIIVGLAILLGILHQDFWNWDDPSLVFGFMPIGLFYHACFSLAAVVLWLFAIKYAWPTKLVEWAEQDEDNERINGE